MELDKNEYKKNLLKLIENIDLDELTGGQEKMYYMLDQLLYYISEEEFSNEYYNTDY